MLVRPRYIAAIAASRGLLVASRDSSTWKAGGLAVLNPWTLRNQGVSFCRRPRLLRRPDDLVPAHIPVVQEAPPRQGVTGAPTAVIGNLARAGRSRHLNPLIPYSSVRRNVQWGNFPRSAHQLKGCPLSRASPEPTLRMTGPPPAFRPGAYR
jgi:hypothetical protein